MPEIRASEQRTETSSKRMFIISPKKPQSTTHQSISSPGQQKPPPPAIQTQSTKTGTEAKESVQGTIPES